MEYKIKKYKLIKGGSDVQNSNKFKTIVLLVNNIIETICFNKKIYGIYYKATQLGGADDVIPLVKAPQDYIPSNKKATICNLLETTKNNETKKINFETQIKNDYIYYFLLCKFYCLNKIEKKTNAEFLNYLQIEKKFLKINTLEQYFLELRKLRSELQNNLHYFKIKNIDKLIKESNCIRLSNDITFSETEKEIKQIIKLSSFVIIPSINYIFLYEDLLSFNLVPENGMIKHRHAMIEIIYIGTKNFRNIIDIGLEMDNIDDVKLAEKIIERKQNDDQKLTKQYETEFREINKEIDDEKLEEYITNKFREQCIKELKEQYRIEIIVPLLTKVENACNLYYLNVLGLLQEELSRIYLWSRVHKYEKILKFYAHYMPDLYVNNTLIWWYNAAYSLSDIREFARLHILGRYTYPHVVTENWCSVPLYQPEPDFSNSIIINSYDIIELIKKVSIKLLILGDEEENNLILTQADELIKKYTITNKDVIDRDDYELIRYINELIQKMNNPNNITLNELKELIRKYMSEIFSTNDIKQIIKLSNIILSDEIVNEQYDPNVFDSNYKQININIANDPYDKINRDGNTLSNISRYDIIKEIIEITWNGSIYIINGNYIIYGGGWVLYCIIKEVQSDRLRIKLTDSIFIQDNIEYKLYLHKIIKVEILNKIYYPVDYYPEYRLQQDADPNKRYHMVEFNKDMKQHYKNKLKNFQIDLFWEKKVSNTAELIFKNKDSVKYNRLLKKQCSQELIDEVVYNFIKMLLVINKNNQPILFNATDFTNNKTKIKSSINNSDNCEYICILTCIFSIENKEFMKSPSELKLTYSIKNLKNFGFVMDNFLKLYITSLFKKQRFCWLVGYLIQPWRDDKSELITIFDLIYNDKEYINNLIKQTQKAIIIYFKKLGFNVNVNIYIHMPVGNRDLHLQIKVYNEDRFNYKLEDKTTSNIYEENRFWYTYKFLELLNLNINFFKEFNLQIKVEDMLKKFID